LPTNDLLSTKGALQGDVSIRSGGDTSGGVAHLFEK